MFDPTILFELIDCLFNCVAGVVGHENRGSTAESDTDSGKGTMTSYSSCNSLNSTGSANTSGTTPTVDTPEQFEVLKQQKAIWETGIEM